MSEWLDTDFIDDDINLWEAGERAEMERLEEEAEAVVDPQEAGELPQKAQDIHKIQPMTLYQIKQNLNQSQNTISDEEFYEMIRNPAEAWNGEIPTREAIKVVPIFQEVITGDDPTRLNANIQVRLLHSGEFHRMSFGPVSTLGFDDETITSDGREAFMQSPQYHAAIQAKVTQPVRTLKAFIVDYGTSGTFQLPEQITSEDDFTNMQFEHYAGHVFQHFLFVTYESAFDVNVEVEVDDQVTYYSPKFYQLETGKKKINHAAYSEHASVLNADTIWDRLHVCHHIEDVRDMFGIQRVKRRVYPHMAVVRFNIAYGTNGRKGTKRVVFYREYFMQCAIFTKTENSDEVYGNLSPETKLGYGSMAVLFRCWPVIEAYRKNPKWAMTEKLAFDNRARVEIEGEEETKKETFIQRQFSSVMGSPFIQHEFKSRWGAILYNPELASKFVIETFSRKNLFLNSARHHTYTSKLQKGKRFNDPPVTTYDEATTKYNFDVKKNGLPASIGTMPIAEKPRLAPPFRLIKAVIIPDKDNPTNFKFGKTLLRSSSTADYAGIPHSVILQRRLLSSSVKAVSARYSEEMGFGYSFAVQSTKLTLTESTEPPNMRALHSHLLKNTYKRLIMLKMPQLNPDDIDETEHIKQITKEIGAEALLKGVQKFFILQDFGEAIGNVDLMRDPNMVVQGDSIMLFEDLLSYVFRDEQDDLIFTGIMDENEEESDDDEEPSRPAAGETRVKDAKKDTKRPKPAASATRVAGTKEDAKKPKAAVGATRVKDTIKDAKRPKPAVDDVSLDVEMLLGSDLLEDDVSLDVEMFLGSDLLEDDDSFFD